MALSTRGFTDWHSFSQTNVSYSVDLLSRFSRAGVETLTVAVGQALFSQFNIPADAQKRLLKSASHLKAHSSISDRLWFGVTDRHLMSALLKTEQGLGLVGVTSCLMVSFHRDYAAEVLRSLCQKSSLTENLTPSLAQWGTFANCCSSAVNASQFPILVEGFSKLLIGRMTTTHFHDILATSPEELAIALLELAPLSRGHITNITMLGKADCAWLAALAIWFFSLRVEIIDHQGDILYQSQHIGHQHAPANYQLTIVRLEEGQPGIPQIVTRSRTHLVPPGLLSFKAQTDQFHQFIPGRSEWNTLLKDAFDDSFEKLLQPETMLAFAQVLYSGLYIRDTDPGSIRLDPWAARPFQEDYLQHQKRFLLLLQSAAARLPELVGIEKFGRIHISELAEREACRKKLPYGTDFEKFFGHKKKGFKDELAGRRYSDALVDFCSCPECIKTEPRLSSNREIEQRDRLCLSRVAIAIFDFIWQLAWLDLDDIVRPSSHALRDKYGCLASAHETRRRNLHRRINETLFLFSGYKPNYSVNKSAFSNQGICVYFPCLQNPGLDVHSQLRLRVVSGQIEWGGKIFESLGENDHGWIRRRPADPETEIIDGDRTTSVIATLGANPSLQILLEETLAAADLKANFVVIPEGKSQVHWEYLYRPFLQTQMKVQSRSSCLLDGPQSLVFCLNFHVESNRSCRKSHIPTEMNSLWNICGESTKKWSGSFTLVDLPWWTFDPGGSWKDWVTPFPDEWIIAFSNTNSGRLRVIRGNVCLIYCIVSRSVANEHVSGISYSLCQADDCLLCTKEGLWSKGSQVRSVVVDCTIGGQWRQLEFRPSVERISRGKSN